MAEMSSTPQRIQQENYVSASEDNSWLLPHLSELTHSEIQAFRFRMTTIPTAGIKVHLYSLFYKQQTFYHYLHGSMENCFNTR